MVAILTPSGGSTKRVEVFIRINHKKSQNLFLRPRYQCWFDCNIGRPLGTGFTFGHFTKFFERLVYESPGGQETPSHAVSLSVSLSVSCAPSRPVCQIVSPPASLQHPPLQQGLLIEQLWPLATIPTSSLPHLWRTATVSCTRQRMIFSVSAS